MKTRRLFVICLMALGAALGAAGAGALVHSQYERAAGAQERLFGEQASRQIAAALEARKQSVGFFRDALDRSPGLRAADRLALARSAMDHTPHWIGSGWIDRNQQLVWWVPPEPRVTDPQGLLPRQIERRVWLRNFFGFRSAFALPAIPGRPALFIVVEPLRSRARRPERLVSVFDLELILGEFLGNVPARIVESGGVLYQSASWRQDRNGSGPPFREEVLPMEGGRWLFQTQRKTMPLLPVRWFGVLLALCGGVGAAACAGMIWAAERLRRLATTDELTGLYNRRFFLERWETEVERARRYGRNLSCLLIDLNGFKKVNDLMGHFKGDQLLKEAAEKLKESLRQSDFLARLGGDEFVVALPETSREQAAAVASKMRSITLPAGVLRPLSLSVGFSQMESGDSAEEIIRRADSDLYRTKPPTNGDLIHLAG